MPPVLPTALIATLAVAALAFAGCGSSDSDTSTPTSANARANSSPGGKSSPAGAVDPTLPAGPAEREAPKGASPVLRAIYRQFPKPKPNSAVVGSATAIKAGEAVCEGKTPLEVKEAFYAQAVEAGDLEVGSEQAKLIAELPAYEANTARDTGFTAGQLAASTYQATLPKGIAWYGYQGCIYSLALRLKRELAPPEKSR